MATEDIRAALRRVETLLQQRPEAGLHDDAPATARWTGGVSTLASHVDGLQVRTDLAPVLGGAGEGVTPGWLVRAGLAACAATRIAMAAAVDGIELESLEVLASSRSDLRGVFGMTDATGAPVSAAPVEVRLLVRIAARDVPAQRLRELVQRSQELSPVSCALEAPLPVRVDIEVEGR